MDRMELPEMRFRAVTVSTIAVPEMSFEFEAASNTAAMEYLCRSVPHMRGAPQYDFELWTVPEAGIDEPGTLPTLLGRTKTVVHTRFVAEKGAKAHHNGGGAGEG
jgi:hypothetical protein